MVAITMHSIDEPKPGSKEWHARRAEFWNLEIEKRKNALLVAEEELSVAIRRLAQSVRASGIAAPA